MDISAFKNAVRAKDLKLISEGVRALRGEGYTNEGIYRLALAGDEITSDHWADLVELALERHPLGTPKERFPRGVNVEMHPATDEWMQGDRFGQVTGHKDDLVRVKLNVSGKSKLFSADKLLDKRLGKI